MLGKVRYTKQGIPSPAELASRPSSYPTLHLLHNPALNVLEYFGARVVWSWGPQSLFYRLESKHQGCSRGWGEPTRHSSAVERGEI